MKFKVLWVWLLAFNINLMAQIPNSEAPVETLFDFWVGTWNLTWKSQDGAVGKGTNRIVKILDNKVIQENFEATDAGPMSGFKGMSLSVFNPQTQSWHQAWTDNQGGYFNFMGKRDGNNRIFMTEISEKEGKKRVQRMVFKDIQKNSFTWDWENSEDGGTSWNLLWQIQYERADKGK